SAGDCERQKCRCEASARKHEQLYRSHSAIGWVKMQKLIEGHKQFLAEVFPAKKSHFHLLSEGQTPAWLFITCADSRVVPDLILGTEPGDLFIARSIGN